jgi:hypothetical protein
MARRTILPVSLLLGLVGCNGSTPSEGTGGGPPSGSTSTSSGTATPTGSAVTLTLDSFTVPTGSEVYHCQDFTNPFGGMDAEVAEFESHMSAGSHHLLLFYKDNITADGPLETCSGLEFAATPYGSQTPDGSLSFPPGVAALVPGPSGLRIQAHYLNTTPSTIDAHVEVTMHLAAPGSVKNQAGVLFVPDASFMVAPHSQAVVSDDCAIPVDMNLLGASSHMHRHGTNFVATIAGNTIYQTTTWSEPKPARFDPPNAIHAGDPLHFACTFDNTSGDGTLVFGESAQTNEMCIFSASFYPTPPGKATITASGCMTSQM